MLMKASVIIPAYNSSERLYLSLTSLKYQDCSKKLFEVIVINNGSDDNTKSMLSGFEPNYEMKVVNLEVNRGRAAARNIGIENSKGSILIFHDSDMLAAKKFISTHIMLHKDERTVICGAGWRRIYSFYYKEFNGYLRRNFISGRWRYKDKYGDCAMAERVKLLDENELMNDRFLKKSFILDMREEKLKKVIEAFGADLSGYNFPWRFFMTNNSSVHRKAVEEIGFFDERYIDWGCEDLDFAYRLYRSGYSFKRVDDAISVHQEHPISKQQNAGKNIYYFTKKYNTIDLMLFYYGRSDALEEPWISYSLDEFKILAESGKYDKVAEAIEAMLNYVRECRISCSNVHLKKDCNSEMLEQVKKLCNDKAFKHILRIFSLLYKEVYGIDIYKSLIEGR